MKRLALAAAALLLVAGCSKSEPASTSAPTGTGAATPQTAPSTAAAPEGEGIPTEEDYEDEAEQKISAQNVEAELDKLEKEITD